MYRFPWHLTLVSTNHASSNLGLISTCTVTYISVGVSRVEDNLFSNMEILFIFGDLISVYE